MSRKKHRAGPVRRRNHPRSRISRLELAVIAVICVMMGALTVTMWIAITSDGASVRSPVASTRSSELPRPVATALRSDAHDDELIIPTSTLGNGKVEFFAYRSAEGLDIRFFVVNQPRGTYQVALDTCRGCYEDGMGYVQVDRWLVCRKCDYELPLPLDASQIHDCQPIRLPATVGNDVRIPLDEMLALGRQFAPE